MPSLIEEGRGRSRQSGMPGPRREPPTGVDSIPDQKGIAASQGAIGRDVSAVLI